MANKPDYGYVKIHRKIKKNPIWNIKPYSKGQAWIDIIMNANHEPAQIILGNDVIDITRGQFHTSELKLADEWGWSRKKVRSFIGTLTRLKMVTAQGTAKGTTITVENYSEYQGEGTTEGTIEGPEKEQRRNSAGYTNKNDKECKEIYIDDFYEQIWKMYPLKKGKAQVRNSQKKKLYSIGIEELARAIKRYDDSVKDKKFLQHGSTFFNSGYVDYLDANFEDKPKSIYQDAEGPEE